MITCGFLMNFHPEHFSEKAKIYEPIKRDNSQVLDALFHTENLTQAEEETQLLSNGTVNETEPETYNLSKEKIQYIKNEGIESKIKLISSVLPAYMLQCCSDHWISHETDLFPPAGAGNQNCKYLLSCSLLVTRTVLRCRGGTGTCCPGWWWRP